MDDSLPSLQVPGRPDSRQFPLSVSCIRYGHCVLSLSGRVGCGPWFPGLFTGTTIRTTFRPVTADWTRAPGSSGT